MKQVHRTNFLTFQLFRSSTMMIFLLKAEEKKRFKKERETQVNGITKENEERDK